MYEHFRKWKQKSVLCEFFNNCVVDRKQKSPIRYRIGLIIYQAVMLMLER